jgi:hypothetical protein
MTKLYQYDVVEKWLKVLLNQIRHFHGRKGLILGYYYVHAIVFQNPNILH